MILSLSSSQYAISNESPSSKCSFLSVSTASITWTPPGCCSSPFNSCSCFLPLPIYFRCHLQTNLLWRPLKCPHSSVWEPTKLTDYLKYPFLTTLPVSTSSNKAPPPQPPLPIQSYLPLLPKPDSSSGLMRSLSSYLIQTLCPCWHFYIGSLFLK